MIVSPDDLNDRLRTAIVAPMTTGSRPAPFRVAVTFQEKTGLILPDQMRTVEGDRLIQRLGTLDDATETELLNTISTFFAQTT